ncbi:MAG: ChaN family lipoprotein [Rhodobacterales bacterium]|nr:ChaN family lipoprotein [Rhodobacterales bacterium]
MPDPGLRPTASRGRRAAAYGVLAAGFTAGLLLASVHGARSNAPESDGAVAAPAGPACAPVGRWTAADGTPAGDAARVTADLARRSIVLLGENHGSAEHHRWQLQTIAALHARNPNMVLAFESFPRSVQPALDAWTRGDLSRAQFLDRSRWNQVWRYDPDLYMPLFHFARMNRIPMVGMNVAQSLVSRVRKDGWDGVPEAEREGLSRPAPAGADYRRSLAQVFGMHVEDKKPEDLENDPDFDRFVLAQTTWDRAMAEKLAALAAQDGKPLVVGIVGQGHVQYGHGIPHQLADLGAPAPAVLLPWDAPRPCEGAVADLLFGVDAPPRPPKADKPRLGVMIGGSDGGVRVAKVLDGTVAQAAGVADGDVIVRAAGRTLDEPGDLIDVVQAMAPGTWLPLTVRRGDATLDLLAKFPVAGPAAAH